MKEIFQKIKDKGGTSYFVGGYVRDKIMGLESKDIDVEVFGLDIETLTNILSEFGKVDLVGKSFGVLKLTYKDKDFDFSLPRKESKMSKGHKGFHIESDENLTIQEASGRRDFTINAISMDTITGEVIDPYKGTQAIQAGILKHTSDHFGEDPLRVLRGFQFAARFDFHTMWKTLEFCEELISEYNTISKERIWTEWEKFLTKSKRPSTGLWFLKDCNWIYEYPALANLINLKQEPSWHPEGDVWNHTLQSLDFANELTKKRSKDDKIKIMLAVMLHDVGKVSTSTIINDRIVSPGHDRAGTKYALKFMESIGTPKKYLSPVIQLIENHMVHVHLKGNKISKRVVRRLIVRLSNTNIKDLADVILSDHNGRGNLDGKMPKEVKRIIEIADELGNEVKPIILGRHLISIGIEPGIEMGKLIKKAFNAQLDGLFYSVKSGLNFIKEKVEKEK